jgi:hypothetical protein
MITPKVLLDEYKNLQSRISELESEYQNLTKGELYLRRKRTLAAKEENLKKALKNINYGSNLVQWSGVAFKENGEEIWFDVFYPEEFNHVDICICIRVTANIIVRYAQKVSTVQQGKKITREL